MNARAVYFEAPGLVALREERLEPGPGQVVVESRLIGISHGTEMLLFRGEAPPAAAETLPALGESLAYPVKYGYLNVGLAADGRRVFAFYPHQDRFATDPAGLVELPAGLAEEDAIFLASMETALGVAHDAGPRYGEEAMVVGLGVVGLLVAEVLRRSGVEVIACERYPLRRRMAQAAGCRVAGPEEAPALVREVTSGRGVDVAVNASASEAGLQLALDCLAFGGTAVEASWHGMRPVRLSLGESFHRRRLRLVSSQVSRIDPALAGRWSKERRFQTVLRLLAEVRPSRYITHRVPLDEAPRAYRQLQDRPQETVQVVLVP